MGKQINAIKHSNLQALRTKLQIVFRDPFASLSLRLSIHDIIAEGLDVHRPQLSDQEIDNQVEETLIKVGLNKDTA